MSRFRSQKARLPPVEEVTAALVVETRDAAPPHLDVVAQECSESRVHSSVEASCHTVTNWGNRHDNEDRIMTAPACHGDLKFHTIGVLDGHDSAAASDRVAQMLPMTLGNHLKAGTGMEEAFRSSLADCEASLKRNVPTAGTCVCSTVIAGRHVWCANLGDCRTALIFLQVPETHTSPTKVTRLCWMSKDHKASCPDEIRRIRAAGGRVTNGRVEGLEPSRTLGDFDVKLQVAPGVISIEPDVRYECLGSGRETAQALLVCGSDGVWDVISGQDVCDLVHARKELAGLQASMLQAGGGRVDTTPLRDLAQDLVQFAVARGSRDDCTAVAAMISVNQRPRE
jgi:serine/threonine protein phosphatase PrpC